MPENDSDHSFEDHGTGMTFISDIMCGIDGCDTLPATRVSGDVHFTLGGVEYSQGRILLCIDHWKRIGRELHTDTEQEARQ